MANAPVDHVNTHNHHNSNSLNKDIRVLESYPFPSVDLFMIDPTILDHS